MSHETMESSIDIKLNELETKLDKIAKIVIHFNEKLESCKKNTKELQHDVNVLHEYGVPPYNNN